ncbi:glyoxalase superfamily protein [Mesorhizobium sp. M1406]|uniref:glyoxalase superfamily protein n=1 Tax=Mesorhizobium sp. M1406 TaxID=2957099 RepID=UPI0033373423
MPKLGAVTPILRIFDIAKAREFNVGFLGFEVRWGHSFDDNAATVPRRCRAHKGRGYRGAAWRIDRQEIPLRQARPGRKRRGRPARYRSPTRSATACISTRMPPADSAC